jgi:nitrile hydratase accessory protein
LSTPELEPHLQKLAAQRDAAGPGVPAFNTDAATSCAADSERLACLPSIPRDEGGPVFAEPWQAQAFALAVRLSAQGYFTWKEWAAALGDELKGAADRGEPDDGSRYYEHWLAALERLVAAKGLSNGSEMLARKNAWADAYRHTPHGKPVELRNASGGMEHA